MNMLNYLTRLFSPKPAPEPPFDAYDYILIPKDARERFTKLVDAVVADKADSRLYKFRLWDFVDTVLPNIGLGWSVIWLSATQPALRRLKSEATKLASPAVLVETQPTSPTVEPSITVAAVSISTPTGTGSLGAN